MIAILLLCLVSSCLVTVINTSPPNSTTTANSCAHDGKYYQIGVHFNPSPCQSCFCPSSGRAVCVFENCALDLCVDAVKQPDQCCSTCPNGWNCKCGDVIIKMGHVYHPDKATVCQCNVIPSASGRIALGANCTSV